MPDCELCGSFQRVLGLTADGHPDGVNRLACDDCLEPNDHLVTTYERTLDGLAALSTRTDDEQDLYYLEQSQALVQSRLSELQEDAEDA